MVDEARLINGAVRGDRQALGELLMLHHQSVFALASALTDSRPDAEDAAQEAFACAVRSIGGFKPTGSFRAWLLKLVRSAAVDLARSRNARRARELQHAAEAEMVTESSPERRELTAAVRAALMALEERYRVPVMLQHCQGLSRSEIAEVLDLPPGTVATNVSRGVERLREALARAGFAAVAVGTALTQLPQPAAPAALAAAIKELVSSGAVVQGTGAAAVGAAAKGGLIVKVFAGVVLAGALAGVAAVSTGLLNQPEPKLGSPPAPAKFATPVTDAGAQWSRDPAPWAGSGVSAYLDGPRKEMCCRNTPGTKWWFEPGGDFTIRRYNPTNERFYTIAGRARGQLDGPFSRARFGGIGYMYDHAVAASPDGRFVFFTEPDQEGQLRVMDFEKQTVATMSKDFKFTGITADSKGNLWGLKGQNAVVIISPEGKVVEEKKLNLTGAGHTGQLFMSFQNMVLDEKHNRLYASNRATGDWTIWYWDLAAGGKFVGVLMSNANKENTPLRTLSETGPFKGTTQRCPGGICFGMDDPERRYLYQGGGDDTTFFRLDLEKQTIDMFGPPSPSDKAPYKMLGWVQSKRLPFGSVASWCGTPNYDEEGNIYLGVALGGITNRYTRVK